MSTKAKSQGSTSEESSFREEKQLKRKVSFSETAQVKHFDANKQ